jgi:signal transduction histidine kinase
VTWEDGVLTVRVVDNGPGFDADPRDYGFGLRQSVVGGLRAVGGTARVSSALGEETVVELRWPA